MMDMALKKSAVGIVVPDIWALTPGEEGLDCLTIERWQTVSDVGINEVHLNGHRLSAANLTAGRLGARWRLTS